MRLKSRIDSLEDKLLADVEEIKLENGQVIRLDQEEMLDLVVEAIEQAAVVGQDPEEKERPELSEKAEQLKEAKSGQLKAVDFIKNTIN